MFERVGYYISENSKKYQLNHDVHMPNRPTVYKPMPTIQSSSTIQGPMTVTQDRIDFQNEIYARKKKEWDLRQRLRFEDKIKKLMGKRARFNKELLSLDPTDGREQKRIVSLNFKIRFINERLAEIEKATGIKISSITCGSKIARAWERIKKFTKKTVKKVKRFFRENLESIMAVGALVVSFIGSLFAKRVVA